MGYIPFVKPTTVSIERYQKLENEFNELLIEHKNLNESQKPQLNISDVSDSFINRVKKEMLYWYGFDLTYEQVKSYLESNNLNFFDTVEREDYVNFLGKTITGMYYPYNGSSNEYVEEFFKRLRENSTEKGYKWVG